MPTSVPNFNFQAPLLTDILRRSQNKKKLGAADLLRRPLADKFLQVAIVPANAYQSTKFQISSSISFKDMRGSQNKNWELLISSDAPLRTTFYTGR